MNLNGYYKVAQSGAGVSVATMFNPETGDSFEKITWDIDDPKINEDEEIEQIRYMEIDRAARSKFLKSRGVIQIGDLVQVFKGRKVPVGTVSIVNDIRPYYDQFRKWRCDYAYLESGHRTNVSNLRLAERPI